ncbi:MAG TPA: glycosyltransferase [Casimicrobiaceae bacterium]|nr:glycosyltransferase [Casimicrobiaceae bacterium]
MTALAFAIVSCVVWIYLLIGRGGFWRAAERDDAAVATVAETIDWPSVVAVIPARDEAPVIGEAVTSLLRQDYRGALALIVVDDHSSDDTAMVARRAAAAAGASERLTVLAAPGLPEGWTGKLWAVHHGIANAHASPAPPSYFLLTDADVRHADDTLTELVRRALRDRLVLTSLLAKLRCVSFAERAMIPAFVIFFQMLFPFAWVNRRERATAAAAGGCMLVESRALQVAGGIDAIREELIDDCALARLLKRHGAIWLGLTKRVESDRAYRSIGDIRRMVARTAYAQLQFSPWWLSAATAGMMVTYLAPPALVLLTSGPPQWLAAVAWALMAFAMQPTLRFYRLSPWWGFALPAIAAAYVVFTLDSAWRHWRGRGGEWKGRVHHRVSASD